MTLEQIIQLGNMGYTKEDIAALQVDATTPAQTVQTVQQPVQTVQQPSQAPAEQPAQQSVDFLEALKLLGQQMQQPVQQPAPVQEVAPAQPVQQPVQQPSINLSVEDLTKLTQGIAVKTAAGSIETPKSANDIILGMLDAYESTVKKED